MSGQEGSKPAPPTPRRGRGLAVVVVSVRLPEDYGRLAHFRALATDGAAGFIVYGGDDELLPPFLKSLREAADRPLLLMTDCERGVGQQVQGCEELPPLLAVGATYSEERAYQHGRATALEARTVGFNMVLAPVADVLSRPANPIVGSRSFGANPDVVSRLTSAWIAGAQDQGVLACAKHFPGHGDTTGDSHTELPCVDAPEHVLDRRELPPFRAAIAAGVGSIMTAHVAYPAWTGDPKLPATLSSQILRDLLRDRLGFGGLVVSDAMSMKGVLQEEAGGETDERQVCCAAVGAGCDLLLGPLDPRAVAERLEGADRAGQIDLLAMEGRLRLTLSDLAVGVPEPQEIRPEHLYGAYGLARDSLTVLRNGCGLLPLSLHPPPSVMAILVDDDRARAEAFEERRCDFAGGFVRRTSWSGDPADVALLETVAEADVVLLGVACAIRAYKGRAGIREDLARMVDAVLVAAPRRVVCVVFGAPGVLHGLEQEPTTLVAAWGQAEVCIRAALDALLSRTPLRGLDPAPGD